MSQDSERILDFTSAGRCRVETVFDAPQVTSDAGVVLVRELLERAGLLRDLAAALVDDRRAGSVRHPALNIIRQRVAQICCGHFTAEVGDRATKRVLLRIGYAFVDDYIRSFGDQPPEMVILDMDPTAVTTCGQQQLALFNGFEDEYCLMPFHVYDGVTGRLIATTIRPGKTPTGRVLVNRAG